MLKVFISLERSRKLILFLCLILSLICLAYLTRGFYYLLIDDRLGAADLYSRWKEQQYIYQGLYPYDIKKGSILVDPMLGPVMSGGYPPWAFFTGFIFFPPISWELTRWYHALLNIISLVILAIFAYQICKPYGKSKAWFTVLACLSISSNATTIGDGQYGIIINALLIGMFWLLQTHQNILAGLLLGLALAKPNISALYVLILIIRQRPKAVLACWLYILVASITIGMLVNVSPLYMLEKMIKVSKHFVHTGYSGVNVLLFLGIDPLIATVILALVCTTLLIAILYWFRHQSLLCLFAIAAVVGRLWTYHLAYDNVMLIFLLLMMFKLAVPKPQILNTSLLILVLFSLLIPGKITDLTYVRVAQGIIWISASLYLLSKPVPPYLTRV